MVVVVIELKWFSEVKLSIILKSMSNCCYGGGWFGPSAQFSATISWQNLAFSLHLTTAPNSVVQLFFITGRILRNSHRLAQLYSFVTVPFD